jgi:hypothetical protein
MRHLTGEEVTDLYPEIFEKVFGFKPDKQVPRTVFATDDLEGFVSGYLIDRETFYLAWGGHTKGMKAAIKCFQEGEKALKEAGVKYFQTAVENTNTAWQRMLMGMGWIPYGLKVLDKIYLEYSKVL